MYIIGLISGTSMDGCDAALVRFQDGQIQLVHYLLHPYPEALRQKVVDCCSLERSNIALTCSLNVELGNWFAEAALALCQEAGVPPADIAAIGSHGQTVWHIPFPEGDFLPSTLQLGEPAVIAWRTGVPVVANFRAMDMAAGGQGAPLVPYPDYLLYRGDRDLALQNLGGIGNVTVLPANCRPEEVFAFDTGPANMIMDGFMRHFYGRPYDEGGLEAARGQVRVHILKEWMKIPYVDAPPPKSTGRELYGDIFIREAAATYRDVPPEDLIATACAYTASSMRRNYDLYVFPRCPGLSRIVLGGGGAFNPVLHQMIAAAFPDCQVQTQEDLGFDSDAKEAMAFAIIARETLAHRPGNLPSATGAARAVPLGSITWPPMNPVPGPGPAHPGQYKTNQQKGGTP